MDEDRIRKLIARSKHNDMPVINGNYTPKYCHKGCEVSQQEIGFTDMKSSYPIIGSVGAGPCIVIALYNPTTKSSGVTHIDALTDLKPTLDFLFSELNSNSDEKLQLHLVGGNNTSGAIVEEIEVYIADKHVQLVTKDVLGETTQPRKLALDTRTGEILLEFDNNILNTKVPTELTIKSFLNKLQDATYNQIQNIAKLAFDFRENRNSDPNPIN